LRVITTLNQAAIGTPSEAPIAGIVNAGGSRTDPCGDHKTANPNAKERCEEGGEQYGIYLGLPYQLNHFLFEHPIFQRLLRYSGVHPWFVEATLATKNGRITRIFYMTLASRVDRANVLSAVDISPQELSNPNGNPPFRISYTQRRNLIPELHAWISPALAVEERARLTDYRLDCLTTFKGCLEPAEINPALWKEYNRGPH
jgi:hypothetical protein